MKICSVEGCANNDTTHRICKGYCSKHYTQLRRNGEIKEDYPQQCKFDDCFKKPTVYGYCRKHAYHMRINGQLPESEIKIYPCSIDGCISPHNSHGYCQRHYKQLMKFGVTWITSIYSPNYVHYYDNQCFIELRSAYGKIAGISVIDENNASEILKYKWSHCKGYAVTTIDGKLCGMHNLVAGGKLIDHIDRDTLNNCKNNLRQCTHAENIRNTKPIIKSSKYKGVCFDNGTNKFIAKITLNRKVIWGGRYEDERDAALAYNELSKKYHGEFGVLNEVV